MTDRILKCYDKLGLQTNKRRNFMAILLNKTELTSGEQLTAQTVNDISETAVEAYKKAEALDEAIRSALNSEV